MTPWRTTEASSGPSSGHAAERTEQLLLAACAALALGWRLWHMARFSLDGDEVFTVEAAMQSWTGMLETVRLDISHPPLFYILVKIWMAIGGDGEAWLRSMPVLLGAAMTIPAYLLAREMRIAPWLRFALVVLVAVNGILTEFSQHLRMFVLIDLTSAVSLWLFVRFLNQPRAGSALLAWISVSDILLVYSHYWGIIVLGAQGIALLVLQPRRILSWLIPGAIAAIAFAPWLWAIVDAARNRGTAVSQIAWIPPPSLFDMAWIFSRFNGVLDIPRSTLISLALFGGVIAAGLAILLRRSDDAARSKLRLGFVMACLAVIPIIVTFALSHLVLPVWGERHLTICALPYFAMVALALDALPSTSIAAFAASLCVAWNFAGGLTYQADKTNKVQWRSLVERMQSTRDAAASKVLVFTQEGFESLPIDFYARSVSPNGMAIEIAPDPSILKERDFWYVYRTRTWTMDRTPTQILAANGYRILDTVDLPTEGYHIVAYRAVRSN